MGKLYRIAAASLACSLLAGCGDTTGVPEGQGAATQQDADDAHYIESLTPANDYYGYINANDLMQMSIKPGASSIGTLDIVAEETKEQLQEIMESIANSSEAFPKGSHEQAIHDMYWLVSDKLSGARDDDAADTAFADAIVERIYAPGSVDELFEMWHALRMDYGLMPFYESGNTLNIYNTEETVLSFRFTAVADLEEIRESQVKAVRVRDELAGKLKFLGIGSEEAKERANNILLALFEVAGSTDFGIINGDKAEYEYYNILSREECSARLSHFSYEQLISTYGLEGILPERVMICDPEQLSAIDALMDDAHLQVWEDITFLKFLSTHSSMFPDKYKTTDPGATFSREDMIYGIVNGCLREQLADLYAEAYFTEEKQRAIQQMCDDIRGEYYELIGEADWLSADGKAFLTDKLDHMEFNIGWSGSRCDVDPVFEQISDTTLFQAIFMIDRAQAMEEIASYGKPDNDSGFEVMPASTVNACYRPQCNDITITAAILNPLVFDENAEEAWNLGAIGSIIGHEISHGFDSNGVLYDAKGNYRPDAMPDADVEAFKAIQDKTIAYYNGFTVLGSHVNGKQTLEENLADISGLQCMLSIAATPEEQQTVLESYAQLWKTLSADTDAKDQLEYDSHSPDIVRVNAVVACFDAFYDVYDVKEGDEMYVAPEERIRRW